MSSPASARPASYLSVHASAGSGKTYFLVSHVIRQLIYGAEPGSILAITFTRKAAAEMQQRLLERVQHFSTMDDAALDKALYEQCGLNADAHLRQQARQLYEDLLYSHQPVQATTFHAFCQDLLRRFPMEAGLSPDFELTERSAHLVDEAWNNFANLLTQQPDHPLATPMDELLNELGYSNTQKVLYQFLAARSEWWALSQGDAKAIQSLQDELAKQLNTDRHSAPVTEFLSHPGYRQELGEFADLLSRHKTRTSQEQSQQLYRLLDNMADKNLLADTRRAEKCLAGIRLIFYTQKDEPRSRKSSSTLRKQLSDAGSERLIELHALFIDRLAETGRQQHAQLTLRLNQAWFTAGAAFVEHYQQVKQFHRCLDFTDLEWNSYVLLNSSDHADWIQYKLDQRINHLLIDEFQDTNPTQWRLIYPLLQELAAGSQQDPRSVLFVGDSKQSIYRFRRAEPRLFHAASHWLEQHLQAQRKALNKSYRSSVAIIDFVNQLFEDNTQLQLDDFEHHETIRQQLSGEVRLLALPSTEEESTDTAAGQSTELRNPLTTPPPRNVSACFAEAQQVAQAIKELMQQPLVIGEAQQARCVEYGDILLLLRNRTHAADYEQALREAHIPYLGTERGTLLDSIEVLDMVTLLKWLITPTDNHALACILRSPMFCAKDADLMRFAGKPNWFAYLTELAGQLEKHHALARACRHLQNWLSLTGTLPVHDLLDRIYSEANVMARYRANYPLHLQSRVRSNLNRFIELALENDSGRYPSLTRFLSWLQRLRQQHQDAPDQASAASQQQRVRIMTIHEAKGLEAPVVFLLDATSTKRNQGGAQLLIDWPGEEIKPTAFMLSPPGAFINACSARLLEEQQGKERQEENNLLYVAVTRAQQYLFISGAGKPKGWYAQICQRFDVAESSTTVCLSRYETEQPACQRRAVQQPLTVATDSALQRPISMPIATVDIAPSRQAEQILRNSTTDATLESELARQRGLMIHRMLEQLSLHPKLEPGSFLRRFPSSLEETLIDQCWQQAKQNIHRFPEYFSAAAYDRALVEMPISYRWQDKTVHGVIDRLLFKGKQITIIDFKSHEIQANQDLPQLTTTFSRQLNLYACGLAAMYPEHTFNGVILFTSPAEAVSLPLDLHLPVMGG